jgi:hypothetical protein
MRILIPESPIVNVIGSVRMLAKEGHEVDLASPGVVVPERFRSRYVSEEFVITSPLASLESFIGDLLRIIDEREYDVVLPFTHAPTVAISYRKAEFEDMANTPVAPYDTVVKAHDKKNTVGFIEALREESADVEAPRIFDADKAEFPCIIKARKACGVSSGLRFASNTDELRQAIVDIESHRSDGIIHDYKEPLIQEYIPGGIHDCLALYNHGEARALMTQERVLTFPAGGGVGAIDLTTQNRTLMKKTEVILDALKWHGPCQVEWKLDERDGRYKLLEINPKLWGTVELAIEAGVPFPLLAAMMARDGDVSVVRKYDIGLRHRWIFPQELYATLQTHGVDKLLSLSRFFLRFADPRYRYSFDFRDPKPNAGRIYYSILRLVTESRSCLDSPWQVIPEE